MNSLRKLYLSKYNYAHPNPEFPHPYVLVHRKCMDGLGAAVAAYNRLGTSARYIEVNYGEAPPDLVDKEAGVFILDFSYPAEILDKIAKEHPFLLVLDHHASAERQLAGKSYAHFDKTRSGAMLAWKYFNPEYTIPEGIGYIQDRDLWKWELPYSKEISKSMFLDAERIRANYRNFGDVVKYCHESIVVDTHAFQNRHLSVGKTLIQAQDLQVQKVCEEGGFLLTDFLEKGYRTFLVNTTINVSETGNALALDNPDLDFITCYHIDSEGRVKLSFRSTGFDTSKVAEELGGGGHPKASGAHVDLKTLYFWMHHQKAIELAASPTPDFSALNTLL